MLHRVIAPVVIVLLSGAIARLDPAHSEVLALVYQQSSPAVVRPLLDLGALERSPFPSDRFTVKDTNQNTGRRVDLPMPHDCRAYASDCEDVAVLNQLDGFNLQARISVPFDGDVDPTSLARPPSRVGRPLSDARRS